MTGFRLSVTASILVAAGLGLVACGGGASNLVTAPSSTIQGATIQGTVDSLVAAASASDVAAASNNAGISVSVVGMSIATTTDSSGRFVLTGIPAGSVTLRFQARGIDATLEISGLTPGQTLTISVHISGSHAHVEPPVSSSPSPEPSPMPGPHDFCFVVGAKAQVEGLIASVDATGITVAQQGKMSFQCLVSATTRIRKGNRTLALADLQVGNRVHVEGTGLGSATGMCQVSAEEIKLQ